MKKEYKDYITNCLSDSKYICEEIIEVNSVYELEKSKRFSLIDSKEYDEILIGIDDNNHLEKLLLKLHKEDIRKTVNIVKLYTLEKQMNFINDEGYFDNEQVDVIKADEVYWVHLETHVNDYCNLNCKACNNYSPFCKEKIVHSKEQFESDILMMKRYKLGRLFILGGEPLLEPTLSMEFMEISRKYLPNTEIRLLTNGLLIEKMENVFWECVRKNKIIIQITQYPPTATKKNIIEGILIRENIKFVMSEKVVVFEKRLTEQPLEDECVNNLWCGSAGCHYLEGGKISKCPDAILVKYIDQFKNREDLKEDFYYIEDCVENKWDFLERVNRPAKLCKYCSNVRSEILKWEPSGSDPMVSDWLINDRNQYFTKIKPEFDYSRFNVVGFGAGIFLMQNKGLLREMFHIKLVVDNDVDKWNKEIIPGITCISPEELKKIENLMVIILVKSDERIHDIQNQLSDLGITDFITLKEILTEEK